MVMVNSSDEGFLVDLVSSGFLDAYIPSSCSFRKTQILFQAYTSLKEEELLLAFVDYVCFRLCMHQVDAQTIHLSIGYSKQTGGGLLRQKEMEQEKRVNNNVGKTAVRDKS